MEKEYIIEGWDSVAGGICQGSKTWKGSLEELKIMMQRPISGMHFYKINEQKVDPDELVPPEYYYALGRLLLNTLKTEDILNLTSTLESMNKHNMESGKPPYNESDYIYHIMKLIGSEEFQQAPINERETLIKERLKNPVGYDGPINSELFHYHIAVSYERRRILLLENKLFDDYSDLEQNINELWFKETYEKNILPVLEQYCK